MTASQTAATIDSEAADPRALLEMMGAATAVFDGRGRVLDVNPPLLELTGRSREEMVGGGPPHPWWSMAGWETGPVVKGEYAISIAGPGGRETPMRCVVAAMPWSASSPGRWIVILAPDAAGDSRSKRHPGQVADPVGRTVESLGWTRPRIAELRQAALLHDVDGLGADTLADLIGPEQISWVRHHLSPREVAALETVLAIA